MYIYIYTNITQIYIYMYTYSHGAAFFLQVLFDANLAELPEKADVDSTELNHEKNTWTSWSSVVMRWDCHGTSGFDMIQPKQK